MASARRGLAMKVWFYLIRGDRHRVANRSAKFFHTEQEAKDAGLAYLAKNAAALVLPGKPKESFIIEVEPEYIGGSE